jgi:hypothetical protein
MPDSNISEEMTKALGSELSRSVSFPVSASDIRRWALAVYYPDMPPQKYIDGEVAPEEFNPFAWLAAASEDKAGDLEPNDPDRTEKTVGIQGPGLKFMLNGGMEVEYGVPMKPGDVITSVMRLADYTEREGRLGLMLFTVSENTWTNQNDEVVKTTRSTLIRY